MSEQRSEAWHEQRRGKFTSSRFNELMGIKGLGKTGETYAFEMACDIVMGLDPDDDYQSYDMQKGIELEPYAFMHFEESVKADFIKVEKAKFVSINDYTGGSPDGIVAGIDPLEIKCPKRNKFLRLVSDGIIDQLYIDQMQHQMWMLDSQKAYFYNYIVFKGVEYGHKIIVQRDEARIDLMKVRLKEAIELREEFINKLTKNKQWN
jgi:putative phage-type endonuclease